MGVMAVRALHKALVHPMLEGHRELRADVGVAGIAELSLVLGQERFWCGRSMDRVATGTDDIRPGVV